MARIFWRVGDGNIHEIPNRAKVIIHGKNDYVEAWVDEESNMSCYRYGEGQHEINSDSKRQAIKANELSMGVASRPE